MLEELGDHISRPTGRFTQGKAEDRTIKPQQITYSTWWSNLLDNRYLWQSIHQLDGSMGHRCFN